MDLSDEELDVSEQVIAVIRKVVDLVLRDDQGVGIAARLANDAPVQPILVSAEPGEVLCDECGDLALGDLL